METQNAESGRGVRLFVTWLCLGLTMVVVARLLVVLPDWIAVVEMRLP